MVPVAAQRIWWPGIILYFAMVLPWFIAVQHRNPKFLRIFFLEHNLQRFATDLYKHEQACLVLHPDHAAGADAVGGDRGRGAGRRHPRIRLRSGGRAARRSDTSDIRGRGMRSLNSWCSGRFFPIVFFSFSKSKLPGYVLAFAATALTILAGDYLNRKRQQNGLQPWLLVCARGCSLARLTAVVLLLASLFATSRRVATDECAGGGRRITGLGAATLILVAVTRFGLKRLTRIATLVPDYRPAVLPAWRRTRIWDLGRCQGSKTVATIARSKPIPLGQLAHEY